MLKTPFLQFDFLNLNTNERKQTVFQNPIEIYQTNKSDEIEKILKQVELAVDNGYYAAGFLSYEATEAFLPVDSFLTSEFPLVWFGIFKSPVNNFSKNKGAFEVGNWLPDISESEYNKSFKKIQNAFNLGLTEQVNYTLQLNADFSGDSYAYYNALKKEQNSDYSCYLKFDNFEVLSLSPELFFDLNQNKLTVKPMKGTKQRGKSSDEDMFFKNELKHSHKDKLENKLIVDLMKDELVPLSVPGSIKVIHPFQIQTFPTLFQMTSTIESLLKPTSSLVDIFSNLFPCGSITGTPKTETINFINKLENRTRDIYCGTIGFISPEKEAIFNVPIRTVSIDTNKKRARYDVGGGITKLSVAKDEYNEAFTKAKVLNINNLDFELIETFGLYEGEYIAYQAHLNRLKLSAAYFNFNLDITAVKNKLAQIAEDNLSQNLKVRLLVNESGLITTSSMPLKQDNKVKKVRLANQPIDNTNRFLYHKTTNRSMYNQLKADFPNCFDIILWNEQNEITEFTIGNIVIEYGGELITPPVKSGLLPGTFREVLLDQNIMREKIITKDMLAKANHVWLINSVRKWVKVQIKK